MGVVALGGAAVTTGLATEALAAQKTIRLNTDVRAVKKQRAVMPDGKLRSRAEMMKELGLDPSTPPDAWLSIIGCLVNGSALTPQQRQVLEQRGMKFKGNEMLRK